MSVVFFFKWSMYLLGNQLSDKCMGQKYTREMSTGWTKGQVFLPLCWTAFVEAATWRAPPLASVWKWAGLPLGIDTPLPEDHSSRTFGCKRSEVCEKQGDRVLFIGDTSQEIEPSLLYPFIWLQLLNSLCQPDKILTFPLFTHICLPYSTALPSAQGLQSEANIRIFLPFCCNDTVLELSAKTWGMKEHCQKYFIRGLASGSNV